MTDFDPTSSSSSDRSVRDDGFNPGRISRDELRRMRAEAEDIASTESDNTILIERSDGRIHPATVEYDKKGNLVAKWDEGRDPETGEPLPFEKPLAEVLISPEVQADLERRRAIGGEVIHQVAVDESDVDDRHTAPSRSPRVVDPSKITDPSKILGHPSNPDNAALAAFAQMSKEQEGSVDTEPSVRGQILERYPLLKDYTRDIDAITDLRDREHAEGSRHGMNQYDSSESSLDDLMSKIKQRYGEGEAHEGVRMAIKRYMNNR